MEKLVRDEGGGVLTLIRQDIENSPKDVRLHFIEQGRDYQPGTSTARNLLAETARIVDVQAPVVLDPSQAKQIASNLLEQSHIENTGLSFSIPPNLLALEPGDIVALAGQDGNWQITDLEGLGLRRVQAKRSTGSVPHIVSGAEPAVQGAPNWVSPPEGIVLDIAGFDDNITRTGPLVGAILSPWVRTVFTSPNGEETETSSPVVVGVLLSDFKFGPVGRYDKGPSIDIKIRGVTLSSLTDEDFLAGGNLLAVETSLGWEVFQCQNAELISPHTYRIDTFLRGLYGTGADMDDVVLSGARVIYLRQGFQYAALNAALRGSHIELEMASDGRASTESIGFDYIARHLRPLSPVHIKAKQIGGDLHISWIRRTRVGGDDWASLDVPLGEENESYEVDFLDGSTVLVTKNSTTPNLQIPTAELETLYGTPLGEINISIAQLSQTFGCGAARDFSFTL